MICAKSAAQKSGRASGIGESGRLSRFRLFCYMNGEVVTIDGGEWLQGAGEFNMLEDIPQEMWDALKR